MKYSIEPIDSNKLLNIANQEADPELELKELKFYKLGNKYFGHLRSGYGSFVSELVSAEGVDLEHVLDGLALRLNARYDAATPNSGMSPTFMKNPLMPGL